MTPADLQTAVAALAPNDPDAAAAVYRRACAAGVAYRGLANRLMRLQDDPLPLRARLAAIAAEFGVD